jgi:TonB-linked SusC/RagA family outer membrane protein
MKKVLLVVTLLAATLQLTFAQNRSVTGKVTDETGAGMPGASVVVKSTANGTISDANGQFKLDNVPADAVLSISSIGYTSQEVTVGSQTTVDVKMAIDVTQLSEVVVVGYGSQERSMVTSAISSVKAEKLKDLPVTSLDQKLQGQLAGVAINQSTGMPGGGAVVRIRGAGSLSTQNGANDPLYVIDGFPITNTFSTSQNPLATINPDDIESMTVLKDAASTAIYGSRGANGVIIINTKRAKAGVSSIEVSASVGNSNIPDSRVLPMMNGQEYAQFKLEQAQDAAALAGIPFDIKMVHPSYRDPSKGGAQGGTDWLKVVNRPNAPTSNYNVTVTKGSENVRALFSLGYNNQDGNILTTGIERYSMRANIDGNVGKNIIVGANISPSYTIRKGPNVNGFGSAQTSLMGQAYSAYPTESLYQGTWDDNGNYTYTLDGSGNKQLQTLLRPYTAQLNPAIYNTAGPSNYLTVYPRQGTDIVNPQAVAERIRYRTYNIRVLANTFVSWQIIPGLTAKATLNLDLKQDKDDQFRPSNANINWTPTVAYPNNLSGGSNNNTSTYNWLNENTLDYNKTFGDHRLSALLGYSTQVERSEAVNINGSFYNNDQLWTLNNATVVQVANTDINEWRMTSLFARVNYGFSDKYVLSGTVRRDGSSRFGSADRYAVFPSISGAWIASNESFFPQNNTLSELKLRVSYGLSGSNAIGNYGSYTTVNPNGVYNFNNAVVPASTITNVGNPNLTWETSKQFDVGLDLAFFKSRITLVTEVYNRLTQNMLQGVNVPWVAGFTTINANQGQIQNRGLEFTVSSRNTVNAIKWTTDLNISMNRNKVLDLGSSLASYSGPNLLAVGQPMGMFTANIEDGFMTAADLANPLVPKVNGTGGQTFVGGIKYKDIGTATDLPGFATVPDGRIDATADRIIYKSPYPKVTFGFTNNVRYKNFDLNVVITASQGSTIFAQYKFYTTNLDGSWNVEKEVANRWRYTKNQSDPNNADNANAIYPTTNGQTGFTRDTWYPQKYFFDGSYINFKNVTLGYNFKVKGLSARVYTSGQNVWLITKYPAGNPEVSTNGNSARQPSIDQVAYPLAAIYTLGVNLKF